MKTRAQQAEWLTAARRGVFRSLGHYRRALQNGPLSQDQANGLTDLLTLLEEYVEQTWVPDMPSMTQQAIDKIGP